MERKDGIILHQCFQEDLENNVVKDGIIILILILLKINGP